VNELERCGDDGWSVTACNSILHLLLPIPVPDGCVAEDREGKFRIISPAPAELAPWFSGLSHRIAVQRFYGVKAMQRLTREDVIKAIGSVDDVTIAQIIGMNATADELAEAHAWLANDEPLLNAGRPLATGRVRELVDILSDLEPGEDDDRREAPAASMEQG
jgi:hypothetical protein